VGSEINLNGLGGGCVFMMDGLTFGLEVCLDHAKDRLYNFYTGTNKRAGDPKVQVQLIPSYGMSFALSAAGREVTALPNGLVFNVDGQRIESIARFWDNTYSCDVHWNKRLEPWVISATMIGINSMRVTKSITVGIRPTEWRLIRGRL
jgi:hypothetical protein